MKFRIEADDYVLPEHREWNTVFAWTPKILDKHFVWLEPVERRKRLVQRYTSGMAGLSPSAKSTFKWEWEYRIPE